MIRKNKQFNSIINNSVNKIDEYQKKLEEFDESQKALKKLIKILNATDEQANGILRQSIMEYNLKRETYRKQFDDKFKTKINEILNSFNEIKIKIKRNQQ